MKWGGEMNQLLETPEKDRHVGKLIVLFGAFIPVYFIIYTLTTSPPSQSIVSRYIMVTVMLVVVLHLFYGYKWARFIVSGMSLVIGLVTLSGVFSSSGAVSDLLFGLGSFLAILVGILFFRSHNVNSFLTFQSSHRTSSAKRLIKFSWLLLILHSLIVLSEDVRRLLT